MRIRHGGYFSVLSRNEERSFVAALLRMTAKGTTNGRCFYAHALKLRLLRGGSDRIEDPPF